MARATYDRNDPDLGYGVDEEPVPQNRAYLVLSDEERAKGFVRPYRDTYVHVDGCGAFMRMSRAIAETYARQPSFYGATYCVGCSRHRPLEEFRWVNPDGSVSDEQVGS